MSNLLISLALIAVTVLVLSVISYVKLEPKWIDEVKFSWGTTLGIASASGFVLGLTSSLLIGSFDHRALVMTTLGWIAGIVFVTDYSNYSIPRGASYLALLPAFIALVWAYVDTGSSGIWMTFGIAMILPLILFFATGVGMGDVRLFALVAVATPWWITFTGWGWALLVASLLGLVSFALAYILKRGETIEHKSGQFARIFNRKHVVKVKEKRVIPFGPPILLGYILMGLFMLIVWGDTMPSDPLLQSPLS